MYVWLGLGKLASSGKFMSILHPRSPSNSKILTYRVYSHIGVLTYSHTHILTYSQCEYVSMWLTYSHTEYTYILTYQMYSHAQLLIHSHTHILTYQVYSHTHIITYSHTRCTHMRTYSHTHMPGVLTCAHNHILTYQVYSHTGCTPYTFQILPYCGAVAMSPLSAISWCLCMIKFLK